MAKIAILTDSGCQLKIGEQEDQGIFIVPLQITINGQTYQDEVDIKTVDVFTRIKDEKCIATTSQPATGVLVEAIEKIKAQGYDHILGITIASGLSSAISGMKVAADMVEMPITLIDSKGTAGNQRYLVEVAHQLIKEGKDIKTIQTILEDLVNDSCTMIMVTDLQHLKRGGRITPAVALLAGLLKIVPVMKLNENLGGKIDSFDKVRTIKKANKRIVDYFKEKGINSNDYVITIEDVLSDELLDEMVNYTKQELNSDVIDQGPLPAAVGVHMGIGGIGYQYIKKYKA